MNTRVIGIRSIFAKLIKAIKWLLISLVVLLLMAFVLESYLKHKDLQKFPPPGKLFQVNGHKMHIWCEGSGNPTIVLDAGASMFSTGWRWVMPELSQATKVCAFDRSGLGWSETGAAPYDGITAAEELHQLLEKANVKKPFIYVGHSLGGNLGQIYYQHYPSDLKALVMVEAADPAMLINDLGEMKDEKIQRGKQITDCGVRCFMTSFVSSIGVIRITMAQLEIVNNPLFNAQALAEYKARTNRLENLHFLAQRGKYLTEIMFQNLDGNGFGDLPLATIYSENRGELLGVFENEEEMFESRKEDLVAWQKTLDSSTHSLGFTEIRDANHLSMVMHQEPASKVSERILEVFQTVAR